jgi:hypothetical protein
MKLLVYVMLRSSSLVISGSRNSRSWETVMLGPARGEMVNVSLVKYLRCWC